MGSKRESGPKWSVKDGKKYLERAQNMKQSLTDTALSKLPPYEENTDSPVPFFHLLQQLKTTKREGWRRFGIADGESISDHMYRMAIMTMLAPPELSASLDVARCTKMALVHDMAEALVGDITPVDAHITKQDKAQREAETIEYIADRLLGRVYGGLAGKDIQTVFAEYEDNKTKEAKFVHDIDKMELLLQCLEYEQAGGGKLDLSEFCHVRAKIQLPQVQAWADKVFQERISFWAGI